MIKFLPSGLCILLNLPMVFGGSPEAAKPSDRPNILVIMSDDQGVGDIGFNNPLVRTPVLDQLGFNPEKEWNYRPLPMKPGYRIRVKVALDGNASVACLNDKVCLSTRMSDRRENTFGIWSGTVGPEFSNVTLQVPQASEKDRVK